MSSRRGFLKQVSHDRTTGLTLKTSELQITDIEEAEQNKIAKEKNEKRVF